MNNSQNTSRFFTRYVPSDSEEEENYLNEEIKTLREEFDKIESQQKRLRSRLRKCYQRLERIKTKRAVAAREKEIRRNIKEKFLPELRCLESQRFQIQEALLNCINVPTPHEQLQNARKILCVKHYNHETVDSRRGAPHEEDDDDNDFPFGGSSILAEILRNKSGKGSLNQPE